MQPDAAPPAGIHHLPTREAYDRWASTYDCDGNPLTALEEPHVDRLLGEVRGLRIADVGCGTGRHSIRLAQRGACVVGLDFSEQMLGEAKKKAGAALRDFPNSDSVGREPRLQLVHHDLAQPLPLADGSFDRVICALVVDHIADLAGLFRQLGRIAKPDGFIVISVMHPTMMLKGVQARFADPETGRETRPSSCPHQVSDYVNAIVASGLAIEHMSEQAADEALAARAPRAAKYVGWPMLLLLRLRPS